MHGRVKGIVASFVDEEQARLMVDWLVDASILLMS
jgi:hypothetical protein